MITTRYMMFRQKTSVLFAALSIFVSFILGAVLFEDLATHDIRLFILVCAALAIAMNVLAWLLGLGFRKLREKKVQRNE